MTGSSPFSSALMMLLMLLALFVFSSFSSPVHMPCQIPREFKDDLAELMNKLKNCSENCNRTACQGLNITVPQLECPFPYFITGIESLNCKGKGIKNLVFRLKNMNAKCQENNWYSHTGSLNVDYEPFILPDALSKKLKSLVEELNSKCTQ